MVEQVAPWQIATMQRRFGALLVDWLLCLLVAGFLGRFPNNSAPLVLIVEYTFFLGLFAQTPGMRLPRIETKRPNRLPWRKIPNCSGILCWKPANI